MRRLFILPIILTAWFAFVAGPASAQDSEEPATVVVVDDVATDIQTFESALMVLAPLVVLVASVILGPEASKAVKSWLPGIIGALTAIAYFVASEFPDAYDVLASNVIAMSTIPIVLYPVVSGILKSATGRSLNELTGPGVVGARVPYGD